MFNKKRSQVFKGALSDLRQFLANESPLKTIKNVFYFTLKELGNCTLRTITLLNTGLYKSVFSTYSFGKLVLCLCARFVFSARSEFEVIFINFCNLCIMTNYLQRVVFFTYRFSLKQFVRTDITP